MRTVAQSIKDIASWTASLNSSLSGPLPEKLADPWLRWLAGTGLSVEEMLKHHCMSRKIQPWRDVGRNYTSTKPHGGNRIDIFEEAKRSLM